MFNPCNAELLGKLAFPLLNSLGTPCWKQIRIFCNVSFVWKHQQDPNLWPNNNMGRSCTLLVHNTKVISRSHQGHFKVKLVKDIENIHFLFNFKLVSDAVIYWKGLMQIHSWTGITSTEISGGVVPPGLPLLHTSFLKVHLNKLNYNNEAACSISFGFHRKRLTHNWVWRMTWVDVVLYLLHSYHSKETWRLYKNYVKCHVYQFMGVG